MHHLLKDYTSEAPYPTVVMFIQDGNSLFHGLTQLPPTFRDTCFKILDQMVAKKNFVFSTDCYHADSIKAQERLRRGTSEKFIIDGPSTRMPKDFQLFLGNDENKQQFSRLLHRVWSSSGALSRLSKCDNAILVVDGTAHKLEISNEKVSNMSLAF